MKETMSEEGLTAEFAESTEGRDSVAEAATHKAKMKKKIPRGGRDDRLGA
jgi:hypothetical protein